MANQVLPVNSGSNIILGIGESGGWGGGLKRFVLRGGRGGKFFFLTTLATNFFRILSEKSELPLFFDIFDIKRGESITQIFWREGSTTFLEVRGGGYSLPCPHMFLGNLRLSSIVECRESLARRCQ